MNFGGTRKRPLSEISRASTKRAKDDSTKPETYRGHVRQRPTTQASEPNDGLPVKRSFLDQVLAGVSKPETKQNLKVSSLPKSRLQQENTTNELDNSSPNDGYMSRMLNINSMRVCDSNGGGISRMVSLDSDLDPTIAATRMGISSASSFRGIFPNRKPGWNAVSDDNAVPLDYSLKQGVKVSTFSNIIHSTLGEKAQCNFSRAENIVQACRSKNEQRADCNTIRSCMSRFCYPNDNLPGDLLKLLMKQGYRKNSSAYLHMRYGRGGIVASQQHDGSVTNRNTVQSIKHGTTANASNELLGENFLFQRRCDWGRSFMSIFHLLLRRKCNYFYYIESTFIVLFISEKPMGSYVNGKRQTYTTPARALLSNSNQGLRRQLSRCNVEYETTLDPSLKTSDSANDLELMDELRKFEGDASKIQMPAKLRRTSSYQSESSMKSSLLSFSGDLNLKRLYNFLLNRVVSRKGMLVELPQLMSHCPFELSSIQHAPVTPPITGNNASNSQGVRQSTIFQIKQTILPCNTANLSGLLNEEAVLGWRVKYQTIEQTMDFNEALNILDKQEALKREVEPNISISGYIDELTFSDELCGYRVVS